VDLLPSIKTVIPWTVTSSTATGGVFGSTELALELLGIVGLLEVVDALLDGI
jgi:hypothetical protein